MKEKIDEYHQLKESLNTITNLSAVAYLLIESKHIEYLATILEEMQVEIQDIVLGHCVKDDS